MRTIVDERVRTSLYIPSAMYELKTRTQDNKQELFVLVTLLYAEQQKNIGVVKHCYEKSLYLNNVCYYDLYNPSLLSVTQMMMCDRVTPVVEIVSLDNLYHPQTVSSPYRYILRIRSLMRDGSPADASTYMESFSLFESGKDTYNSVLQQKYPLDKFFVDIVEVVGTTTFDCPLHQKQKIVKETRLLT